MIRQTERICSRFYIGSFMWPGRCSVFCFNIIVFFVLYFDNWYVLYMHNLKHICTVTADNMSEYRFSLTRIFSYNLWFHPYMGIYRSEKTQIPAYFTQCLCMYVFHIMHITKNCNKYKPFNILYYQYITPVKWIESYLFLITLTFVQSFIWMLHSILLSEVSLVSAFNNMLVSFIFT